MATHHHLVYKVDNVRTSHSSYYYRNTRQLLDLMEGSDIQPENRRVILIVGVFFGVLALIIIFCLVCCLCWRRKLIEEVRASRLGGDYGRELSAGVTMTSRADLS